MVLGNIYPSNAQSGKVIDPAGIAPTVCENHGEVTRIVEARRQCAYKEMPDGSIRGFNAASKDKSGISEEQYTSPQSAAPAVTTSHPPKVIESEGAAYRIRKLTPRECFRLQDVDEASIDKLQAVDEKGNLVVSKSQQYKLAGNSITVACLYHIFSQLFNPNTSKQ